MSIKLKTYLKLCTEYYDLNKTVTDAEFAFYLDYAKKTDGPVLEPMCGTGRLLIPMLQAGIDIEGFDASFYMLDALRKKKNELALHSHEQSEGDGWVWQAFVQDFKPDKQYRLIFIPFGSWGLITDSEIAKKSLKIMYDHLAPGGTLLLEIDTVYSVPETLNVLQENIHTRSDGSLLTLTTVQSYNQITQLFHCFCRYESIVNGSVDISETEDFEQHLYRFDELDEQLKDVGFSRIIKYQDYQKTPAQNETPLIIYECVK